MSARRKDGLAVLARLKRHEMENVSLEMAEVNRALGRIEAERQALLHQLDDRGDPNGVEATRVVSDFVRNVSALIHQNEAEADRLRASSAGAHDRLNALFAEAKRIDLVSQRRAAELRHLRERKETAAQNEAFLSIWLEGR